MKVFCRASLAVGHLLPPESALLLEGDWPADLVGEARWSLDGEIDGRFAWIDREAADIAAQLSAPVELRDGASGPALAYLNSLQLRYYLVKLLRVVAFFQHRAGPSPVQIQLFSERGRDEDYQRLIRAIADAIGARLAINEFASGDWRPDRAPPRSRLRHALGELLSTIGGIARSRADDRVVLCGDPRVLDPVCEALLERGAQVWWLYEQFAIKSLLRWRAAGVRQIACTGVPAVRLDASDEWPAQPVLADDVDLSAVLGAWLRGVRAQRGGRQAQMLSAIRAHFAAISPTRLILDEDATPLKRAALAVARSCDCPSSVVQHGLPAVRFGYAPLVADHFYAWNAASTEQLLRWGVPGDKIEVVGGCGLRPKTPEKPANPDRPGILFLLTTPPRDDRPDAVEFHLTTTTYHRMLTAAFEAAGRLKARLIVKPHPRSRDDGTLATLLMERPGVDIELAPRASLASLFARASCVVSCASTAGFEAKLNGLPVALLLPEGSGDILPVELWPWDAAARSGDELHAALESILRAENSPRDVDPAPHDAASAAKRIVDHALAPRSDASSAIGAAR